MLDALREPISRQVFDYLARQSLLLPAFQRLANDSCLKTAWHVSVFGL